MWWETVQTGSENDFQPTIKTLRNSIKPILGKDCPLTEDILFNKRPEQLSVAEFIDLTNKVEEALKTAGNNQQPTDGQQWAENWIL